MTLNDEAKKAIKHFSELFFIIICNIIFYNYCYKMYAFFLGEKSANIPILVSTTITLIADIIFYFSPRIFKAKNKLIVENTIQWKANSDIVESLDYSMENNFEDNICSLHMMVICKPKRRILFSLLRFAGTGIIVYGSGSNFGFTKNNSVDSPRYRVLNNKKIFIKSFYKASKNDEGNTWEISFDFNILDPSFREGHIYSEFAFGTKKHKFRSTSFLMKIIGNPLTVNLKENN